MRLALLAAVVSSCLVATTASAAPRAKITDICPGCIATVPDGTEPAPVLTVLHGDWGQMAPELHATWERFAASRGVALLALACPASLGCKGSWWKWNGDPAWITEQVDHLAAKRPIDRSRLWLAGWSGGASYIGLRTQELERTFTAIVIHGGGIRPMQGGCAAEKSPIVFLVGDKNPLHSLALGLRDHYEGCGNEITFLLVPGGEHSAEWKALDARGPEIMDRLASAKRVPPAIPSAVATVSAPDTAVVAPPPEPSAVATPTVPPRAGCGCTVLGRDRSASGLGVTLLALASLAARALRSRYARSR